MPVRRIALVGSLLGIALLAMADEEMPGEEFLEYLGSWGDAEEDWEMLDMPHDELTDSAPESAESTEMEDEC